MNFIQRRIILSIVGFVVAINLIFIIPRLVPGNAAIIFASGSKVPATAAQLLTQRLGLNESLTTQYSIFMRGLFSAPPYFGVSYEFYPEPVSNLIISRLPWTLLLLVSSMLLSFTLSYFLAAVSSMRRRGKFEIASLYGSIFFWSIPAFWIAMILIWSFAVYLPIFPLFGTFDSGISAGLPFVSSVIVHAVLPVVTLTAVIFGQSYMLLRSSALEVQKSDYVLAAKARGLKDRAVAFQFVLRNSLLPVVSLLGYSIASIISAEILVEAVFSYGGVGDLIVDAVINRDYPVIEGSFFYVTLLVILFALVGDIMLAKLDPRLR